MKVGHIDAMLLVSKVFLVIITFKDKLKILTFKNRINQLISIMGKQFF